MDQVKQLRLSFVVVMPHMSTLTSEREEKLASDQQLGSGDVHDGDEDDTNACAGGKDVVYHRYVSGKTVGYRKN